MRFKSKSLERFLALPPLLGSFTLHASAAIAIALLLIKPQWKPEPETVEMEIYEVPKLAARPVPATPQAKPMAVEEPKRAVFGATKKTMVSDVETESVKLGNTLAKTPDQRTLTDDDEDSLPIPVDEFLVSSMPKLKNEFRIPYPAEAREKNVQGAVVMDLLVDQNGKVRDAKLVTGPGFGLNEAALEAVKRFEFEPAKAGEQTVPVRVRYSYRFVLEK